MDEATHSTVAATGNPGVSVIIPTYNRSGLVGRALRSVMAQTYRDFEVIVIDDASTDDTAQVVVGFPGVRYLRNDTNLGGAASRNRGIAAARGDYVAFLDSDDEWLPHKLELQVEAMVEDQGVGAVYCGLYRQDDRTGLLKMGRPIMHRGNVRAALLAGWCPHTVSQFLVRRRSLEEVGGFDAELAGFQDTDLWIRLSQAGAFEALDEPLVISHDHQGPRLTTNPTSRGVAIEQFLAKWEPDMLMTAGRRTAGAFRRRHLGDHLAFSVLASLEAGERRRALADLGTYLRVTRARKPAQLGGLLLATVIGTESYETVRSRWTRIGAARRAPVASSPRPAGAWCLYDDGKAGHHPTYVGGLVEAAVAGGMHLQVATPYPPPGTG
ncbi:MAG: glycosyltransferase family 2 protein, partial [Acidimicrobiia bacterium]